MLGFSLRKTHPTAPVFRCWQALLTWAWKWSLNWRQASGVYHCRHTQIRCLARCGTTLFMVPGAHLAKPLCKLLIMGPCLRVHSQLMWTQAESSLTFGNWEITLSLLTGGIMCSRVVFMVQMSFVLQDVKYKDQRKPWSHLKEAS